MLYNTLPCFPTNERCTVINYLINDSFHFFFTHWSDVVRKYYHYFILYRSTLGWIKNIYNNTLTPQEKQLYHNKRLQRTYLFILTLQKHQNMTFWPKTGTLSWKWETVAMSWRKQHHHSLIKNESSYSNPSRSSSSCHVSHNNGWRLKESWAMCQCSQW